MRLGRFGRSRAPNKGRRGASSQPHAVVSWKKTDRLERRVIFDSTVNGLAVRGDRAVSNEAEYESTWSRVTSENDSRSGCSHDSQWMKHRTSQPIFVIVAGRAYCTRRAQR